MVRPKAAIKTLFLRLAFMVLPHPPVVGSLLTGTTIAPDLQDGCYWKRYAKTLEYMQF
jgi:hypothetical protein